MGQAPIRTGEHLGTDEVGLFTEDTLPFARKQPRAFWICCFAVGSVFSAVVTFLEHRSLHYLLLCLVLDLAAFLVVPAGLHLCRRWYLAWARSAAGFIRPSDRSGLQEWFRVRVRFFEGSTAMLFAGVVLGVVATIAYLQGGYIDPTHLVGLCWGIVQVFASSFMAGCSLWLMYKATCMVADFGKSYRDSIVVIAGRFGILSTGRMLACCWGVVGISCFLYTGTVWFGPPISSASALLHSWPVRVLTAPILPLVIGCFIAAQLPLHKAMVAFKENRFRHIGQMLETFAPDEEIEKLTKDQREKMEFLQRLRAENEALPEWPFDFSALASVAGSSVTAIAPHLVRALLTSDFVRQQWPHLST